MYSRAFVDLCYLTAVVRFSGNGEKFPMEDLTTEQKSAVNSRCKVLEQGSNDARL